MAEPLRNMYNVAFFESLCPVLKAHIPDFDCAWFISRVFDNDWPDRELKQRVSHIAQVLGDFLPADAGQMCSLLKLISQKLREAGYPLQGFACIFLPEIVAQRGLEHPEQSLSALHEITKLVSAEFAIRPFLKRYPEITLRHMNTWTKDKNEHVRRLASEGCRSRLPWGAGVPGLKENPKLVLPILEALKDDESLYVRKSVANNLNDIGKDHPELLLKIARSWGGISERTDWIVKHASRSLMRKGNSEALKLQGYESAQGKVKQLSLTSARVRKSGTLEFHLEVLNAGKTPAKFRVDYAIDFLTQTGRTSRKVFRLREQVLAPKESIALSKKQSFIDRTTRKHYRGKHRLDIIVNGKVCASADFLLQEK